MDEEKQVEYLKTTDMILVTIKEAEKRIKSLSTTIEQEEANLIITYRDKTTKILNFVYLKRWAYIFILTSAMIAAFYGLLGYYASTVDSLIKQKNELKEEIRKNQEEIEKQKQTTWGIAMHETGKERFYMVPKNLIVEKYMNNTGDTVIKIRKNAN